MNVLESILPIFIIFDHGLVLMHTVEVSHSWWGFKVVDLMHIRVNYVIYMLEHLSGSGRLAESHDQVA